MFDFGLVAGALMVEIELAKADIRHTEKMRKELSPEAFKEWKHERDTERRHRELCQSIERAGSNSRFRLF